MTFAYTVHSEVDDDATSRTWSSWLCEVHLADVIAAGALRAELVQLDALHFESRYLFASRQAYEQYIAEHSVRLREMTIAKFSTTVRFRRETGVVLCSMP